jgi:hypothetical protein
VRNWPILQYFGGKKQGKIGTRQKAIGIRQEATDWRKDKGGRIKGIDGGPVF